MEIVLFVHANLLSPLLQLKLVIVDDTETHEFYEVEYIHAISIGYSQNILLFIFVMLVHLLTL